MKHLKLFAALCCTAVLFAACTPTTGTENGHGYVDLGLPSGIKWATCNVGATAPEAYGNYYAWGEITTKDKYSGDTYKWSGYERKLTKYNTKSNYGTVDNKTTLTLADDAARANWGGRWRMPTDVEWEELINSCTWTWTRLNGVNGYEVTSKTNGNSIFLPAAGYRRYGDLRNAGRDGGFYWPSSLCTDYPGDAWYVYFGSYNVYKNYGDRCNGLSVRPVFK